MPCRSDCPGKVSFLLRLPVPHPIPPAMGNKSERMNTVQTEAIVLTTRDYGESDRLITFHTRSGGRLRGIAKGARRSRKRFANTFEPCSLVELTYKEKKSLIWIEAAKLVEPHLFLRTDIVLWGYAALISEVLLEMVPEGEGQPELFSLTKETLAQLSQDKDPLNVVLLFLLRFQDNMGYLPDLEYCGVCRRELKSSTRWCWNISNGGLVCPEHCLPHENLTVLDLGTLLLIQRCRKLPLNRIWRLRFIHDKRVPLFHGLLDWVRGHIGKDLNSMKLLRQVQSI